MSKERWQHPEPEFPPQRNPELGELSSKAAPSQRDLKPDVCPGKKWQDRCSVDFLLAPSLPCWDPHQNLGYEEAAAAQDCTDAWQDPSSRARMQRPEGNVDTALYTLTTCHLSASHSSSSALLCSCSHAKPCQHSPLLPACWYNQHHFCSTISSTTVVPRRKPEPAQQFRHVSHKKR